MSTTAQHAEACTVILEPHPLFRVGIEATLATSQRILVYGNTGSSRIGRDLLKRHQPQVMVADLELADSLQFNTVDSPTQLIVLSADSTAASVVRAVSIGALSFLHKSVNSALLISSVLDAARGQRIWHLGEEQDDNYFVPTQPSRCNVAMTNREMEIFAMLLRRMTNEEIADHLVLARQTVKNYVSNILQKLGMPTRTRLFREFTNPGKRVLTAHDSERRM